MTKYHKQQAEIRYNLDNYVCVVCGAPGIQIAHRISRTKINLKKYGEQIINHHLNMAVVCGLECNQKISIENRPSLKSIVLKNIGDVINSGQEKK